MTVGDPYKFSIFASIINEWNTEKSSWRNGVLLFCINGEMFPKQITTATLNSEIHQFRKVLMNITINETLFNLVKEKAFLEMYHAEIEEDFDSNHSYSISPTSLLDSDCYVFAVSNGNQTRVLAAKLNYIIKDSTHDLSNIDISETFISSVELNEIVLNLDSFLKTQ